MWDSGPWSDTIVRIEAEQREAFTRHLVRLDAAGRELRFGCEATDAAVAAYAGSVDLAGNLLLGVVVDGEIRAAAELGPCPHRRQAADRVVAMAPAVYLGAISVEPEWRRRGIGFALLVRALAAVRGQGGSWLMLDGLACCDAMRRAATRFGAEMTFDGRDCQAWFQLAPHAGVVAEPAVQQVRA